VVDGKECRGLAIFIPGDTAVKFLTLPLPQSEAEWATVDLANYVAESEPTEEWVTYAKGVSERWYSVDTGEQP